MFHRSNSRNIPFDGMVHTTVEHWIKAMHSQMCFGLILSSPRRRHIHNLAMDIREGYRTRPR